MYCTILINPWTGLDFERVDGLYAVEIGCE